MIEAGQKLAFLPAGAGRMVAVLKRGGTSVVTHVLVRQVSLRQRYDIQSVVDRYAAQFPESSPARSTPPPRSAVLRRYGG